MGNGPQEPYPNDKRAVFGDIDPNATLWLLIPKTAVSIAISAFLLLLIFWLQMGRLDAFAFGFTGFIAALQLLMIAGLRFRNRYDVYVTKPAKGDWIDKIGALWLVSCAFGAFLGWICGTLAASWPAQWRYFYMARVLFAIILPGLTILPNLRYLQVRAAVIQVPILTFITILPVLSGMSSVFALVNNVRP